MAELGLTLYSLAINFIRVDNRFPINKKEPDLYIVAGSCDTKQGILTFSHSKDFQMVTS